MRPRILVIDASPVTRETIAIILADDYDVAAVPAEEYLRLPNRDVEMFIIGDDVLPVESVAALPPNRPVLWLHSEGHPPHHTPGWSASVPRSFNPEELRIRVRSLLEHRGVPQWTFNAAASIAYPVLPKEATILARRAAGTNLPVLICGEPGTGKARLARTIHGMGRGGRFVTLPANNCTEAAIRQAATIGAGNLTLFIDELNNLAPEAQQLLLALLDTGGIFCAEQWHGVRLIGATSVSFDRLANASALDKDLFYRLSVFPVRLPPLRERTGDIPALAEHVAAEVTRLLSVQPVTFTQRAIDRLVHYYWFGNLAELEAVLTRSIALTDRRPLDVGALVFGYGRLTPQTQNDHGSAPRPRTVDAAPADTVDLIINELAHEFKNPMVTIKTITQHLERLLADETGREQVARLTGDAVDRMDRALENLLQFTRFRAPSPAAIPLNALLAPCLTELTPTLTERRVLLNYRPPEPVPVFVDAAQVGYAFENLLRTIVRDLPEGKTLGIQPLDTPTPGVLFEFPGTGHPLAGKLATLIGDAVDETALPLGLVFAKSIIERNGGHIDIRTGTAAAAISVWLPNHEVIAPENGNTTRIGS